jgi:nitrate/nitrite transporter NarK
MTNAQSALLLTVYAIASLVIDVPGGMICDRIDSKMGLIVALLGTTAVTVLYGFFNTSFAFSVLVWALLAFLSMGIYWPLFSKVLNIIGSKTGAGGRAGSSFGVYYAFNGISAALVQGAGLWLSTRFEDPVTSFRVVVLFFAGSTLLAALLIQFLFDKELAAAVKTTEPEVKEVKTEKQTGHLADMGKVLKNHLVWMTMLICMIAYCLYSMMSFFTPYLTAVVGISPESSGVFAIIRTYVFLLLAPVGGFLADKIFKGTAKWIMFVYISIAVFIAGLFLIQSGANVLLISIYTLIPAVLLQMSYPIRYSIFGEIGVSQNQLATVTGMAAFIGALPDLILGPVIGYLLDTRGNAAYTVLFVTLIIMLLIGSVCALIIVRSRKKTALTQLAEQN